ncbi:MAG: hypothetical protein K0S08_1668 [Gammaproteobacteria bacterium]|jgi:hypothetical protein|nr:hypothetical protein [Gammaproteobacteria bacterium]
MIGSPPDDEKSIQALDVEKPRLVYQSPKLIILDVMLTKSGPDHVPESSNGLFSS